jgi:Uma2 family endonuclease
MTMATVLEAAPEAARSDAPAAPEGDRVVLANIRWETYERLLTDLADSSAPRLTYDGGLLEIMSPSPAHESANRALADLIQAATEVWGIEVYNLGSTTFRSEDRRRGFEPDTCFYIQHLADVVGKDEIDLTTDPAPDLVVEIDHTSPSLDKLPVLAALGVPEVWRYSPRQRTLTVYVLQGGTYRQADTSVAVPLLTPSEVERFMREFRPGRRLGWLNAIRDWAHEAQAAGSQSGQGTPAL